MKMPGAHATLCRRARVVVEAVEARVLLSTWTVTNLNDSGPGSLRDAIQHANANAGDDTIDFLAGLTGTITLTSGQLEIGDTTGQTTIVGPGAGTLSVSGNNDTRVFFIDTGAVANMSGLTITGGLPRTIEGNGGGILNRGTLDLADCTFSANKAPFLIGGAVISYHIIHINRCTFTQNTAGYGGAVDNETGTMTITDSEFSNNATSQIGGVINGTYGNGGAIDDYNGSLTVTGCTFAGNVAPANGHGGAIENEGGGTVHLANCIFFGNSASVGGAIDNQAGALYVSNSTISGNSAYGGGIFEGSSAVLMQVLRMANTIVAGNFMPGANAASDIFGTATGSYNLVGDGSGQLSASDHNLLGTPAAPLDPRLAPLGSFGGPTPTMPLLAGSPALDAGSNALAVDASGHPLTTDQRGLARVFNGTVDLGAYESQPPALVGDVNHDGLVNFSDLLLLAQHHGTAQPLYEGGDLTGDGTVTFDDLLALAQNYGRSLQPAAANPPQSTTHDPVGLILPRLKRRAPRYAIPAPS